MASSASPDTGMASSAAARVRAWISSPMTSTRAACEAAGAVLPSAEARTAPESGPGSGSKMRRSFPSAAVCRTASRRRSVMRRPMGRPSTKGMPAVPFINRAGMRPAEETTTLTAPRYTCVRSSKESPMAKQVFTGMPASVKERFMASTISCREKSMGVTPRRFTPYLRSRSGRGRSVGLIPGRSVGLIPGRSLGLFPSGSPGLLWGGFPGINAAGPVPAGISAVSANLRIHSRNASPAPET